MLALPVQAHSQRIANVLPVVLQKHDPVSIVFVQFIAFLLRQYNESSLEAVCAVQRSMIMPPISPWGLINLQIAKTGENLI